MNEQSIPLSDQLANISPTIVVAVIAGFTILRLALVKLLRENWARTISETCDTVTFVLALAFLLIRPFVAQAFYIPSESMVPTLEIGDRLIVDKMSFRFRDPQRGDVLVFAAPPEATGSATLEQDYIKRCIGLPGDKIEVHGAKLTVGAEVFESQGVDTNAHAAQQELRNRLGIDDKKSVRFFKDYVLVNRTEKILPADIARQFGQPGAKVELTPGEVLINGKPLDEPYINEDPGYNMSEFEIPSGHYFMMGDNRNHSADSHVWGKLDKWRIVGRGIVTFWPVTRLGRL
ncbi:signal peptidase I [Armatimonas sp.]|uniref:signal peptidase I n=1 Tax=Armatimonas sp. TaxID=1872638 RepID=UPI002869F3CD|nr:signal peptidase I [Armatimonas sp.]